MFSTMGGMLGSMGGGLRFVPEARPPRRQSGKRPRLPSNVAGRVQAAKQRNSAWLRRVKAATVAAPPEPAFVEYDDSAVVCPACDAGPPPEFEVLPADG